MLLLIWQPGLVSSQTTASIDSTLVPTSMLRQATARIDAADLRIMLLENRAVERDSVYAGQERFWQAALASANERADLWRDDATSWWHKHESAVFSLLGMAVATWALN